MGITEETTQIWSYDLIRETLTRMTFEGNQSPNAVWSPDGQTLAFMEISSTTGFDLWVLSLNDHKAKLFLQTPFNESAPRFSPDGHWLAYVSNE
jgi:Tol biopolymer transport system component